MNRRTRYVQVGLGGRHGMFRDAVIHTFKDQAEMVGICDLNAGRLRLSHDAIKDASGVEVPMYAAAEFDRMIRERRPDKVMVTTQDSSHDEYICRAMELGCDVITEKPMTIDERRCSRILETRRRTGRTCTVTFNYRYSPPRTQIKELLMSGVIGEVLSVDFHWLLDTTHGADYFRRWHRNKENSGGLMVHKSTHHFDLVNWWLSTVPETVFAAGRRAFYTPSNADRLGLAGRGDRCHTCPEAETCCFRLSLAGNTSLKALYLDNERHDGYVRDRCVFSETIDIEDSMNVVVGYESGVKMTYSLNAFSPWEGYVVVFNGTRGRLEHKCEESVYVNADGSVPGALKREGTWIRVYPLRAPAYHVTVAEGHGGHGGGDNVMLRYIFDPASLKDDTLKRAADERSGAWSILTGIAANHSMRTNQPIRVRDLVRGLELPDYPPALEKRADGL